MQQAGIAQPLIGIDNNKPNDHEVYFILECYFHGEGKHEIERIKCLVAPTTDKIMFPDVFKAKSAYEFMQCPEQSFFVDTLSDIIRLNVVNALSQMSKIPKDTIEDNLYVIIDEFSISAADIKTNIIYWTVTGSFKKMMKYTIQFVMLKSR